MYEWYERVEKKKSFRVTTNFERLLPYTISCILFSFFSYFAFLPSFFHSISFCNKPFFFSWCCRLLSITSSLVRSLIFTLLFPFCVRLVQFCVLLLSAKIKVMMIPVTKENHHLHFYSICLCNRAFCVWNRVWCTCSVDHGAFASSRAE